MLGEPYEQLNNAGKAVDTAPSSLLRSQLCSLVFQHYVSISGARLVFLAVWRYLDCAKDQSFSECESDLARAAMADTASIRI